MEHPTGEAQDATLGMVFDRRLKLEFHGSKITSDAGLLAYRELDHVLGLGEIAGEVLTDTRTGANGRHSLSGQFRQSVFGRLAGYEDVNDADRLAHDPAMRWIVGGRAVTGQAASTSQMGRFETEVLVQEANLSALTDLSGCWIDTVHARRPVKVIVLDMDSSVSPTYGEQEGTAYNGHFGCTCYHPLFVFNQFGDLERCALRPMRSCRRGSRICSSVRWAARRMRSGVTTPASAIRPRVGAAPVGSWPRSSGTLASFIRVSAFWSRICAARPSGWWPSTINAARPSSGSERVRPLRSGRGCRADRCGPTRCGFSFMPWRTTSRISCARWPCRTRSSAGR